jgi:glycosyltransferase involved in cell wall biosynthesis
MPGTMTRLTRSGRFGRPLRLAARDGRALEPLAGKHVAVFGSDVSPHITGFPQFTSSVLKLLRERAGQVSEPLRGPLGGTPDLVVAVLPGPGAAGAAVELANRHAARLLVIVQGETAPPTEDARTNGARLAAKLEGTALRRADRWAVTGAAARSRLLGLRVADARIDSLPYWVPSMPSLPSSRVGARPQTQLLAARQRLGWPEGFLVVCPVGVDTTGLVAVVAAAHELARRRSEVHFVLAGRGPRLRALEASARSVSNVTVAEVPDDTYSSALAAADLLLLSEAADRPDPATAGRMAACLAAGRPMLAALADGGQLTLELSRSEGAMVTVPPDRYRQLADAIDVLSGAPAARAVMAAGARHYTRACLGTVAAAAALEAIVARTLGQTTGL